MTRRRRDARASRRSASWLLASPVLALALIPLFANWTVGVARRADRHRATSRADLLNSVEPYGVLVTVGDNDTFPLWYAQEVEGIRPRRHRRVPVAAQHRLVHATALPPSGLRVRSSARAGDLPGQAVEEAERARRSRLTMDEADAVPPAIELSAPQTSERKGRTSSSTIQPDASVRRFRGTRARRSVRAVLDPRRISRASVLFQPDDRRISRRDGIRVHTRSR